MAQCAETQSDAQSIIQKLLLLSGQVGLEKRSVTPARGHERSRRTPCACWWLSMRARAGNLRLLACLVLRIWEIPARTKVTPCWLYALQRGSMNQGLLPWQDAKPAQANITSALVTMTGP